MGTYLFIFRGSQGGSDALAAHMRKWYDWAGALAVDGNFQDGQPLTKYGRLLFGTGQTATEFVEKERRMIGYMLVNAANFDEAVRLAGHCPIFEVCGSVEVREGIDLAT